MLVLREAWLPTEKNGRHIEEYARKLIRLSPGHQKYWDDHQKRLAFDLDHAERFLGDCSKILEIGGDPFFLTLPLMTRYDVRTLDRIAGKSTSNAIREYGIKSLNCDLDYDIIPSSDASFDGIIMNEVFEHLRVNLIFTMREVLRILRPGGTLLLSTPNLRSIKGIYNFLFRGQAFAIMGGVYENYAHLETGAMGHTREYTSIEVVDFLQKTGFAIDAIIYRGSYSGSQLHYFGWRQRWGSKAAHQFTRICPQFRPFFTVVARKPQKTIASFFGPEVV